MKYTVKFIKSGKQVGCRTIDAADAFDAKIQAVKAEYGANAHFRENLGMPHGDDYAYGQVVRRSHRNADAVDCITDTIRVDVNEVQP